MTAVIRVHPAEQAHRSAPVAAPGHDVDAASTQPRPAAHLTTPTPHITEEADDAVRLHPRPLTTPAHHHTEEPNDALRLHPRPLTAPDHPTAAGHSALRVQPHPLTPTRTPLVDIRIH
jgi:hypothetical protein